MLGLVHFYDMICKLLLGGKNLGAGAAEEGDKGEVDHYVFLHHQGVLHLFLLLLLLLLLLNYSTEITTLAEDKTEKVSELERLTKPKKNSKAQNTRKTMMYKVSLSSLKRQKPKKI